MQAVLPQALQQDFDLVGEHVDHVVTSWGEIRFSKLTRKHAESLIARGYLGIRRKSAPVVLEVKPADLATSSELTEDADESVPEAAKRVSKGRKKVDNYSEGTGSGV